MPNQTINRLALEKKQHARSYREDRQEVASVGETEAEKRCRQKAEQDQLDGQQQHPQVLGQFHDDVPRFQFEQVQVMGGWGNHDFGLCFDPDDEVCQRYSAAILCFRASL